MTDPRSGLLCLSTIAIVALGLVASACKAQGAPPAQQNELQNILDRVADRGGGVYRLSAGTTVIAAEGVVVPVGVTLDLNGGTLVAPLWGPDSAGVRLLSNSGLRNGTVTVRSRGRPGSQSGAHAAVLVGALLGEGGTPGRRSPFADPAGWTISNVTLTTDKALREEGMVLGAPAVQVMGGAHDGLIENVTVPDSSRMSGIHLDWGTVGPIRSSEVARVAAAYRQGGAYTTHPHNISIRSIRIGRLTRPAIGGTGSFGIRLSGVDNVSVLDVSIGAVTEAGVLHTAGDLGYEFARPADRARAHLGIVIDGVTLGDANGAYLFYSDSYADNVARAVTQGYRAMLDPIARTDMRISRISGRAGTRPANFGFRLDHQRGGSFSDILARGFRRGFYIDEQVFDVTLDRPVAEESIEAAISVEHPHRPPTGVTIVDARTAGSTPASRTVLIGRSSGVRVIGGNARVRVTRQAEQVNLGANLAVSRD